MPEEDTLEVGENKRFLKKTPWKLGRTGSMDNNDNKNGLKNNEKNKEKTNDLQKKATGWEQIIKPNQPEEDKTPVGLSIQPEINHSISPETDEILEKVDRDFKTKRSGNAKKTTVSNLLIIGGILLIIIPLLVTAWNAKKNKDAMDEFLLNSTSVVDDVQASAENPDDFYQNAVDFNAEANVAEGDGSLASPSPSTETENSNGTETTAEPSVSPSAEASASPAGPTMKPLMSAAEIQKRMIGVLYIDKIKVRIPVMDGVDVETLRVAAGRMPESGKLDKIGNAVLAGHRSYTFGKYFNRLDELEVGDTFYIKTGKKTLEYKIFKKIIVEPDDFSIMNYNKTDKICTLFTCHPVIIANKRLVVQGIQTD